jgi:biotin operon repressor
MSDIQQHVRRDDDLPPMARLLFAEIWQMNEGDGECYAEDEWLGKQIGAAESTVRRHRLTLRQKGYIKQSKSGGRRYLEPNKMINNDQSDQKRSESTCNDDQNDQKRSEEVINSDQHRGSNNLEGASTAPAHEDRDGKPDWAPTLEDAKRKAEMKAPKIPPETVEEWWLYREEHDWDNCGEKWILNLKRWHMNDDKFDPGGGGDGASSRPSGTQFDPSKDQIRFGA